MKVAVIGSRTLTVQNLEKYLPREISEMISGGAKGIDACARSYDVKNHIPLTEYLPDYEKYGRSAPIRRNITIIQNADLFIAFWDGHSRGTAFVLRKCREMSVPFRVYMKQLPCKAAISTSAPSQASAGKCR